MTKLKSQQVGETLVLWKDTDSGNKEANAEGAT